MSKVISAEFARSRFSYDATTGEVVRISTGEPAGSCVGYFRDKADAVNARDEAKAKLLAA